MSPSVPKNESAIGKVVVHAFGCTDVGRTREHNEDAFLLVDLASGAGGSSVEGEPSASVTGGDGMLFMVADGLGGAAAGEIASGMAIEEIRSDMTRAWRDGAGSDSLRLVEALRGAVEVANGRIHAFARENPEHKGMGTTATVAVLRGDTLYVAQIGDSRAYLVRNGVAQQITKDQSLMQRLIEAGELTPEEAERSERRNIILQALGPEGAVRIDLTYQRVRQGDRLVLCTDGLSGVVKRDDLSKAVSSSDDLSSICFRLIEQANAAGGPDNITVVAARFEGSGLAQASQGDRVGHQVYHLNDDDSTPTVPHAVYVTRTTGALPAVTAEDDLSASVRSATPAANRALALAVGLTLLAAILLFGLRQLRSDAAAPTASPSASAVSTPAR